MEEREQENPDVVQMPELSEHQQEVAEMQAFFKAKTIQLFEFMGEEMSAGLDDIRQPDVTWMENLRVRKTMERRRAKRDLLLQNMEDMEAMIDQLSGVVDKTMRFHSQAGTAETLRQRAAAQVLLEDLRHEVETAKLRAEVAKLEREKRNAESDLWVVEREKVAPEKPPPKPLTSKQAQKRISKRLAAGCKRYRDNVLVVEDGGDMVWMDQVEARWPDRAKLIIAEYHQYKKDEREALERAEEEAREQALQARESFFKEEKNHVS